MESFEGECSLYWNYLVQSFFLFGVGTAFPHLFFSTTPLDFFQLHVHSVILCLCPSPVVSMYHLNTASFHLNL